LASVFTGPVCLFTGPLRALATWDAHESVLRPWSGSGHPSKPQQSWSMYVSILDERKTSAQHWGGRRKPWTRKCHKLKENHKLSLSLSQTHTNTHNLKYRTAKTKTFTKTGINTQHIHRTSPHKLKEGLIFLGENEAGLQGDRP
jgi:hypothetical protein